MATTETNDNMDAETAESIAERITKQRIGFYKTALKIFRGRCFTLNAACEAQRSEAIVPDDMQNYNVLQENVKNVQNAVAQMKCLHNSIHLIRTSLACDAIDQTNDNNLKREILHTAELVSAFSRQIIKSYESYSELEHIKIKRRYRQMLENHQNFLKTMKESREQSTLDADESRRIKKVEKQVEKINVMRAIKAILIGKFAGDHEVMSHLQQFRNPNRQNLTVEDFVETWNVGTPP